jgi:hypothetical protein
VESLRGNYYKFSLGEYKALDDIDFSSGVV